MNRLKIDWVRDGLPFFDQNVFIVDGIAEFPINALSRIVKMLRLLEVSFDCEINGVRRKAEIIDHRPHVVSDYIVVKVKIY